MINTRENKPNSKDKIMKRFSTLLTLAGLLIFMATAALAQTTPTNHGPRFVDMNGDGFNDNAPDADGDGIPNGQDADYTGVKSGKGFVDANGDGINDNAGSKNGGKNGNGTKGGKNGSGKGNKGGNKGSGSGTGTCNGTGQGKMK